MYTGYIRVYSCNSIILEFRELIAKHINIELESEEFNCCSKNGQYGVFTGYNFVFQGHIFIFMIFKRVIQRELDRYIKEISGSDFTIREISKKCF